MITGAKILSLTANYIDSPYCFDYFNFRNPNCPSYFDTNEN